LFRAKLLERWRTELVEVVVHELIDRFAPRGRADLVREFTFAFLVQVISWLMGLPREDYVRFSSCRSSCSAWSTTTSEWPHRPR